MSLSGCRYAVDRHHAMLSQHRSAECAPRSTLMISPVDSRVHSRHIIIAWERSACSFGCRSCMAMCIYRRAGCGRDKAVLWALHSPCHSSLKNALSCMCAASLRWTHPCRCRGPFQPPSMGRTDARKPRSLLTASAVTQLTTVIVRHCVPGSVPPR